MSINTDTLIIGGGPAGIATALALGESALLVEKGASLGGLSTSFELAGAIMDFGGHSFHTPHPHVRDLVFNSLEMEEQVRNAKCFVQDEYLPYPFQQNFHFHSDESLVAACRAGLEKSDARKKASNFHEHIENRFGPGISEHFMLPYNRKLWGDDLSSLSADWTGERVAAASSNSQAFSQTSGKRKPLQANTKIAYPARGGFGEIFNALAQQVSRSEIGVEIGRIDPIRKKAVSSAGQTYSYNRLVSTLPLPLLLKTCEAVPLDLIAATDKLEALSLTLVFVVCDHPVDTEIHRVYCSEPQFSAHKVTINHTSSKYLRQLPSHGIVLEISHGKLRGGGVQSSEKKAVQELLRLGLVKDTSHIIATKAVSIPHAYPRPTHSRDSIVADVKAWLRQHDIETLGRFGEWAYINCDEAIHRGLSVAGNIAEG